ncbi:hypothetical protein DFH06DRAFT_1297649 [Mycena polygramma]|nr:hypothetical protein DFH06DRAFT_1297649 [Mycena polygramma]
MVGRQECGKRARYTTLLRFPDLDARAERRCHCEGVALHRLLATAKFGRERATRADGDGQDLFQSSGFPELSFEEGASAPGMRSSKPSREAQRQREGVESESLTTLKSRKSENRRTAKRPRKAASRHQSASKLPHVNSGTLRDLFSTMLLQPSSQAACSGGYKTIRFDVTGSIKDIFDQSAQYLGAELEGFKQV